MPSQSRAEREHLAQARAYEMKWRPKVFYALRKQKKPIIDKAKADGVLNALLNIDYAIKPDHIADVLKRMYYDVIPKVGAQYLNEFSKKGVFDISPEWIATIDEFMKGFFLSMVEDMTEYTKRILRTIIMDGLNNADSYDEIIKRLEDTGIDKTRASAIARTETNRSMGYAKYDAIGKLPYAANVVWIAARDNRTRGAEGDDKADHYHLNGQTVPFGTPFTDTRSGAKMLYPGDVTLGATAADVVNCRCTIGSKRAVQS